MGTENSKIDQQPREGALSPPLSIVSEAEVPYVSSFSADRPIGETSPKRQFLARGRSSSTSTASGSSATSGSTARKPLRPSSMVVVSEGKREHDKIDSELERFQKLPNVVPILKSSVAPTSAISVGTGILASTKDPEVLDKLDPQALKFLCLRYQEFLRTNGQAVCEEQLHLEEKLKEIDKDLAHAVDGLTQRQKRFTRIAEEFSHVHEISRTLRKCKALQAEILSLGETVSSLIPPGQDLPPPSFASEGNQRA
ncbi:unnamed protein product [Cyprideis torosa]|uniref:BLOC-1-related complex subunit 5 n=1 Tax=Cyprideis torosa TaxID=163714 RepID=A0A7R8ZPQ9_9CRUS|nr:unnamed protein product [Cyprideis torosa]CAG0894572.1 unnamed protein product [Cyprideis torosa]